MTDPNEKPRKLPAHQSAVRAFVSGSKNLPYIVYETLEQAKADPDSAVVFEADWGGQIYLTIPARHIACGEDTLRQLLAVLDSRYWNEPKGANIFFEHLPVGSKVTGGMGGGLVVDGLWLHEQIKGPDLRIRIEAALKNKQGSLLETCTIHVYLPEEGVDCWRPVCAEHLGGDKYRILDETPDDEVWEFKKGDIVRCRIQKLVHGITPVDQLVAFEIAK